MSIREWAAAWNVRIESPHRVTEYRGWRALTYVAAAFLVLVSAIYDTLRLLLWLAS
jgi:hypothetical protein